MDQDDLSRKVSRSYRHSFTVAATLGNVGQWESGRLIHAECFAWVLQ